MEIVGNGIEGDGDSWKWDCRGMEIVGNGIVGGWR